MTSRSRQLLACALLLIVATTMLMALNYAKLASSFEGRLRDRQSIVVRNLADELEGQLALGITVMNTFALKEVFEQSNRVKAALLAIAVLDEVGANSSVIGLGESELWKSARLSQSRDNKPRYAKLADSAVVVVPLRNAFNVVAGWLALEYQVRDANQQTRQSFASLWPAGLLALLGALALLALAGPRLGTHSEGDVQRSNRRLTVFVTCLLMAVQGVFAWSTYQAFTRINAENAPMLGATLAQTVRPGLLHALDYDIPLNKLNGVNEWLSQALAIAPEFNAIAVRDANGQPLYKAQSSTLDASPVEYGFPIEHQGMVVGKIFVDVNLKVLAERSRQLAIEFITLLLIGALLSHEMLKAISTSHKVGPADELSRLRLPLFLFFLSSELPRSFLPVWSNSLAVQPFPSGWHGGWVDSLLAPVTSLPETVLATIPISAYLLSMALASPFAGKYCARRGSRSLLSVSVALAIAGHLCAFFADSLIVLCVARVIAGLSFGCASVAAFDYIGSQPGGRAAGMGLYLSALVAAGICGTGIGALIVDRAGIPVVFAFGMVCSALTAASLTGMPASLTRRDYISQSLIGSVGHLLATPAFLRLIVLITLPMQIVQQGLLFYWAPLALAALGESTSFVGLAMMCYFLAVLLLNGPSARFADLTNQHNRMVMAGMGLAAVACAFWGVIYNPWFVAAGVVLIGVAWAIGFPSTGALSLRLSQSSLMGVEPAVSIGVYRTIERTGAMLAPILVAFLIVTLGYQHAALVLGAVLLSCALLHGWVSKGKPNE